MVLIIDMQLYFVFQQANGGRFRLRDLLAVPMQRVLKYHLLLRELLSHTSISHEEYPHVQQAYEAMLDVAGMVGHNLFMLIFFEPLSG